MTTSRPGVDPRAVGVAIGEDDLTVSLADGRRISVPLVWFPKLLHATPVERSQWRLIGEGQGIHWPDLDEDVSVEGLLLGKAASGATRRAI